MSRGYPLEVINSPYYPRKSLFRLPQFPGPAILYLGAMRETGYTHFKEFIRICGMTHVRTSPYYPQSNGKLERFHGSIKGECIRPGTPLSLEDALRIVGRYVEHYNQVRLHSAIGYIAPVDKLVGHEAEIFAARDRKLAEARQRRKEQREAARLQAVA